MSSTTIIVLVVAAVAIALALLVARSRRSNDGVDSFRRQIDALSPEARRPVIDQVQNAAGRQPPAEDEVADDADDEDGARGT